MDNFPASPEQAAELVWFVSLALGLVVSLVVAYLLWLIHRTAMTIDVCVSHIWDVGQRVANNTVHIPALYKTNELAGEILAGALKINNHAAAIEAHTSGCPGCPRCILKHQEADQ
jgi:hypothetical protein